MSEIFDYVKDICEKAKNACPCLLSLSGDEINAILLDIADALEKNASAILEANELDMNNARDGSVKTTMLDRLRFSEDRIKSSADAVRAVAKLSSPIGTGERQVRPNGLTIEKIRVPLGCIGMIYEARPNVTVDAAALALKTGNACVLRGGKEAINTNKATVGIIRSVLSDHGINEAAVSLIERTERESSVALMNMRGLIDVLIPRGGAALIKSVSENATVPCIETGAGNCHIFVNRDADIEMAVNITANAKTSRPSVCNAAESLVVHSDIAKSFLPALYSRLGDKVELRGCERTREILPQISAATDDDHYTEYNDYILSVIVVDSIDCAIKHINSHSTKHSEAIVTKNLSDAKKFQTQIDSACVYVNASTRFTDGGEFGLGAEIGISTQKLHARGPMGLFALTTEKYLVSGDGQIR
jgi:glutamate-5-semialdehyde dehydrogenase